jgi:hypothetical protein
VLIPHVFSCINRLAGKLSKLQKRLTGDLKVPRFSYIRRRLFASPAARSRFSVGIALPWAPMARGRKFSRADGITGVYAPSRNKNQVRGVCTSLNGETASVCCKRRHRAGSREARPKVDRKVELLPHNYRSMASPHFYHVELWPHATDTPVRFSDLHDAPSYSPCWCGLLRRTASSPLSLHTMRGETQYLEILPKIPSCIKATRLY